MNEENNRNTITYDEDWKTVSSSEYPKRYAYDGENEEDEPVKEEKRKKPKKDGQKHLLITIQLIACLVIALFAFLLKFFGGEVYQTAREWYYTELNRSVISDSDGENYILNLPVGNSTSDEA